MEYKQLITAIALLIMSFSWGQEGFYKIYAGDGHDVGEGAVQLADSGFLVVGTSSSLEEAPSQILLLRTDKKGNFEWSKTYGGAESEEGKRVFNLKDYGHLVVGTTSSGPSRNFDAYIFATDVFGKLKWDTIIDNGGWERVHDARLLADSTLIIVGETDATTNGNKDAWILALAYDGSFKWKKQIGSNFGDDILYGIAIQSDTSLILVGTTYDEVAKCNKANLLCTSPNGIVYWEKLIGTDGYNQYNDVLVDGNRIKAVGQTVRAGRSDYDNLVVIAQENGDFIRTEETNMAGNDTRYQTVAKFATSPQGNMIIGIQRAGGEFIYAEGEDAILFRGNHELYTYDYMESYSNIGQDQINELIPTLDGYVLAVGYHSKDKIEKSSLFIVKISNEISYPAPAQVTVYNIASVNEQSLVDWTIAPNPASSEMSIVSNQVNSSIEIQNVLGEIVWKEKFNQATSISVNQLASGTYLLKCIQADGSFELKRVVVSH